MKKLLIISIAINCLIVAFFVGKRLYWSYGPPAAAGVSNYETQIKGKYSAFNDLRVDSGDIVFIGNSLVEGFRINEYFPGKKIKNRGVGGSETIHLIDKLPGIVRKKPGKLFIEIGVNDIVKGQSSETILENLKQIISIARKESPLTKIYVHSLLPTTDEYTIYNDVIRKYNSQLEPYCASNGIDYIGLYNLFENKGRLNGALTYDGIHLNDKGYAIWVNAIKGHIN